MRDVSLIKDKTLEIYQFLRNKHMAGLFVIDGMTQTSSISEYWSKYTDMDQSSNICKVLLHHNVFFRIITLTYLKQWV